MTHRYPIITVGAVAQAARRPRRTVSDLSSPVAYGFEDRVNALGDLRLQFEIR